MKRINKKLQLPVQGSKLEKFSGRLLATNWRNIGAKYRASDISRKKTQNFAGFSGAKSRKNRPISRDFRGKKVKICGKIGRFRRIFAGKSQNSRKNPPISREKSQNSQENRPISRHFSGKKSNFEGFSGANSKKNRPISRGNFAKKQSVKDSRFRWVFFGKFR